MGNLSFFLVHAIVKFAMATGRLS
ncbi:hypothetical protein S40285_09271 [Stachybotrys chlorohalonatus IBT 40285]|uniref:Uncharacterized protein n=1 Tax=Stachybotrys chlorohalonatus (strain IBT 40285) TaxID=1283841 RepID=A0A084R2Z5_STAC4|nr:hypothetical protein S40285_09271 [Stachybotrys chlorohalonata IBT 40285]